MDCPDCGYIMTAFDLECERCKKFGKPKMPTAPEPPITPNQTTGITCSNCNMSLTAGQMFCLNCGLQFLSPVPGHTPISYVPAPRKTSSRLATFLGVVIIGTVFTILISGAVTIADMANIEGGSKSPAAGISFGPQSRSVTYRVSGTARSAGLTYQNPQQGTVQKTVTLPWSETQTFKDGDYVYLSAQNEGDYGNVTTEILIDNAPWKTTTSEGGYTIADCHGLVEAP